MTDKTLSYLDYRRLLDILKSYSQTRLADELVSGLLPFSDPDAVQERQEKLAGILEVVKWDGRIPLSDIP